MEFLIMLLETISKFGSGLSTTVLLSIFIAIIIYFLKDNKKYREATDAQFKTLITQQDEMKKEYRKGLAEVNKNLIKQGADTQRILEQLQEQQFENQRLTLRGLVTNESLPDEYRHISYDRYKALGGNSWLDKYVDENLNSKREKQD